MTEVTLRRTTCVCATFCMIAQIGSLYLLFTAFSIRGEDLVVGSSAYRFASLGTCVATPHVRNLENAGYNDPGYSCVGDEGRSNKFSNLVQASVHGLYWASKQTSQAGNTALQTTASAAMTSIMGGTAMPRINASLFYEAVEALDSLDVPASCDTIYGKTSNDFNEYAQSPSVPKPVLVSCTGGVAGSGETPANINNAYTHCVQQHSFGRHGPAEGTYAMPLVPNKAGPMLWSWPGVSNFSDSSSWDVKARMMLGARFSWSVSAYVAMALTTGFFAMSSAVVVLAEVTFPERAADEGKQEYKKAYYKELIRMMATTKGQRILARILGTILVVISWVMWAVCILGSWGFASRLGRPQCEVTKRENYIFLDTSQIEQFYSKTGWKLDWTAHVCEVLVLTCCTFTLVAIPISENLYQFPDTPKNEDGNNDKKVVKGEVDSRSRLAATLILVCLAGTAVLITGFSLVQNTFGMAWARAVSGEADLGWQSEIVALALYDMAKAWIFAVITAGMVHAVVMSRWTINGENLHATLIFYVWVVMACLSFLPLLVAFGDYFMDQSKAVADCSVYRKGGSWFDKEICTVGGGTLIAGTLALASVVTLQFVRGIWFTADGLKNPAKKMNVVAPLPPQATESFFNFPTQNDVDVSRKLLSKSPVPSEGVFQPHSVKANLPAFNLPIRVVTAS